MKWCGEFWRNCSLSFTSFYRKASSPWLRTCFRTNSTKKKSSLPERCRLQTGCHNLRWASELQAPPLLGVRSHRQYPFQQRKRATLKDCPLPPAHALGLSPQARLTQRFGNKSFCHCGLAGHLEVTDKWPAVHCSFLAPAQKSAQLDHDPIVVAGEGWQEKGESP
jgi:hypothetical protein